MSSVDETTDAVREQASVRHLVALGYVDPWEVAAQRAIVQREQQQRLKDAEARLEAGEAVAAVELLESIVAADLDWATPRHLLARGYFRAGRPGDARTQLDWLEFHAVEHAELSLMRAKLALQKRELGLAREHAAYAACLHDPLPAADLIIGKVDLRHGDLSGAESAYRRAVAGQGNRAAACVGLAAVALRRGAWEEAVDFALQAIEDSPRLAVAHYRLGMALAIGQLAPEATAALETAAALNPLLAGPFRWLAHVATTRGDGELAARRRRQAGEAVKRRRAARLASGGQ